MSRNLHTRRFALATLASLIVALAGSAATASDLESRIREPIDLDAASDDPDDLDAHRAGPDALPPVSAGDAPAPGSPDAPDDPAVVEAQALLREAQLRHARAQRAYAEMKRTNYPRGEARADLLREREAAAAALDRAEERLRAARRGVGAAPPAP